MKRFFVDYPHLWRLVVGAILTTGALILSGVLPIPVPHFHDYFPFLGVVLITLATWFMYWTEGKDLRALGFDLRIRNLLYLPAGLVLGILGWLVGQVLVALILRRHFLLNPHIDPGMVLRQLYFVLPAAAVQELLVRGYCYQKLIEMTGVVKATIAMGLVFVAMHDVWGAGWGWGLLYALVLFIGHLWMSGGLLWSGTLYLAIGLHWGNNLATQNVAAVGSGAKTLFLTEYSTANQAGWLVMLIWLAANAGFLVMIFLFWKYRRSAIPGLW